MRIEYGVSDEDMQKAKELIASTKPARIRKGRNAALVITGIKSVLSVAALVGGGVAYAAYVFKLYDDILWTGVLALFALAVTGYAVFKAVSEYIESRRDVSLSPGMQSCIEVLISQIHFIDNGVRSRLGRFDIKKFLNIQGFFLIYLHNDEVIVVPPNAFSGDVLRDQFKEAVNEIIRSPGA